MPGADVQLDGPETDIVQAATLAMKPFEGSGEISHSAPKCDHEGEANGGTDTVEMRGTYTCMIPVAKGIVCLGGAKTFTVHAQFPHQGAEYKL